MEGLAHGEVRNLSEKIGEQPENQSETEKNAEYSVPSWMVRFGCNLRLGIKK